MPYLFTHFKEKLTPDGEQVYFAVSKDGFNWEQFNGGEPILTAKKGFEMQSLVVEYDKDFDNDDLFYANGYQAWTTSREFSKNDKFDGLFEPAKITKFT